MTCNNNQQCTLCPPKASVIIVQFRLFAHSKVQHYKQKIMFEICLLTRMCPFFYFYFAGVMGVDRWASGWMGGWVDGWGGGLYCYIFQITHVLFFTISNKYKPFLW